MVLQLVRWPRLLSLFFSALLISTTATFWLAGSVTAQQQAQYPEELAQCFPSPTGVMADYAQGQPYHFALLTTDPVMETDQRLPYDRYYLFVVYWHDMSSFTYTLIGLDNRNGCHRLVEPWSGFDLTYDVSFESAKQLALIYYGWLNTSPQGRILVQSLIAPPNYDDEEEDILYLSAEQAWALQQLGYGIPSDYEILPPNTPESLNPAYPNSPI